MCFRMSASFTHIVLLETKRHRFRDYAKTIVLLETKRACLIPNGIRFTFSFVSPPTQKKRKSGRDRVKKFSNNTNTATKIPKTFS